LTPGFGENTLPGRVGGERFSLNVHHERPTAANRCSIPFRIVLAAQAH